MKSTHAGDRLKVNIKKMKNLFYRKLTSQNFYIKNLRSCEKVDSKSATSQCL